MYIPDLKFRQIKIKLEKNKWIHLRFSKPDELKDYLDKSKYLDCYYSSGAYRNPITFEDLMFKNLIFDVDERDQEMVLRIIDFINRKFKDIKLLYILSTFKGYQVVFDDPYSSSYEGRKPRRPNEPKKLELWYYSRYKNLCEQMEANGLYFDYETTYSKKRVIRIPETRHNQGVLCSFISHEQLRDVWEKSREAMKVKNHRAYLKDVRIPRPSSLKKSYLSVSNKVQGIEDKYVLYFKYPNFSKASLDLENLNSRRGIFPMYAFECEDGIHCIGVKCFSRKIWKKITRESCATNKNNIEKYNQVMIRLSNDFESINNIKKMKFIGKFGDLNSYSHYSATHSLLLWKFYSIIPRNEYQIGEPTDLTIIQNVR